MVLVRLGALIIAPLLYLLAIAALAASLAYAISLGPLDDLSFSLLVTRGAQVLLLISLIPLSRYLAFTALEMGLPKSPKTLFSQIVAGFVLGLLILSLHVALLLSLGAIKLNHATTVGLSEVLTVFANVIWVGLLVGTIEELIFRGALLAGLRRLAGPWPAAAVSSLYYALLHFVKSDLRPAAEGIEWISGFQIFADAVRYLLNETPVDCLLALFCAGLFLAGVRLILPRSLAFCIGIHAGWIVVIKVARRLTDPDPHAPLAYLVGPYDQIIGYGAALWITLLLALLVFVSSRWRTRADSRRGALRSVG